MDKINIHVFILGILIAPLFAIYEVGDTISEVDQDQVLNACHGGDDIRLSDYLGKIIWIEFSATW